MDWVQDVTLAELLEKYVRAGLDPAAMRITSTHVRYQSPETAEERARLEEWKAKQAERTERWERETYERLREKFEDDDVSRDERGPVRVRAGGPVAGRGSDRAGDHATLGLRGGGSGAGHHPGPAGAGDGGVRAGTPIGTPAVPPGEPEVESGSESV